MGNVVCDGLIKV